MTSALLARLTFYSTVYTCMYLGCSNVACVLSTKYYKMPNFFCSPSALCNCNAAPVALSYCFDVTGNFVVNSCPLL